MTNRRILLSVALGLALTLAVLWWLNGRVPGQASAISEQICVSRDTASPCHASIQEALNIADDGDTIRVSQGTYTAPLVITKSIRLEGGWRADFAAWNPGTYTTTIDAQRSGPAVSVKGQVSTTIDGFVVTGGDDTEGLGHGGGIRIMEADLVTVRGNVITGNVACTASTCRGQGGGIAVYSTTVIITGNAIINNIADTGEPGGGDGGGVYIQGSISATVANNRILNNTATVTGTGRGGGVYADGVTEFSNNLVQGNDASVDGDGSGGGIYAVRLENAHHNTVVENRARRGGGIHLSWSQYAQRVYGNLVARNHATGEGGVNDGGGGITSQASDAEIVSNDIVSNTTQYFGGGLLLVHGRQPLVRDNVVSENTARFGGGIFLFASDGTLTHNWIVSNTAVSRGGGLYIYAGSAPIVDANYIVSNSVTAGEGGGICIRNNKVPLSLSNQVIARNSSHDEGSGIYVSIGTSIYLLNNTLVDNGGTSAREGMALLDGSEITATNNIIVGHGVAISVSLDSTATLSFNDYWDNKLNVKGGSTAVTDLMLDPRFIDRQAGDYHLDSASPLIDAGDNSVNLPHDVENDLRPIGAGGDIGADEVPIVLSVGPGGSSFDFTVTHGLSATLEIPPSAVSETTTIVFTPKAPEVVTDAPYGQVFAGHVYDLNAYQRGVPIDGFGEAVKLALEYADSDMANVIESTLAPYRRTGSEWEKIGTQAGERYVPDINNNLLTVYLLASGRFAHFGTDFDYHLFLPLVLSSW